jgi:hypothetical protein
MARHEYPPPGPRLTLEKWARRVTDRARRFLPELRATGSGRTVTWACGPILAVLNAGGPDWWLQIPSATGGPGSSTHTDRHDGFTAEVATSNIVVHFDPRFCRGLSSPPYTDHELQILTGKA